ncbi:uncharacterized protein LOC128219412 [Mya arenaria]|nr:uncharacterized protein LOC128219412 [Mya arenaria]
MIDERNMSGSSETISVNDTPTDTNTIQMTLNGNAKRDWNSKSVICTQQTDLFTDNVSDRKIINCKYPPSTLFMENPRPPLELQEVYFLTFRCNISDFNDNCSLNWNWDKSEQDSRTEQTNGLSTFVLNATKEDNEHTLICSVHCSSFQVNLSDSYTIRVPFLVNQRKESITEPVSCSPLPWVAAAVVFFILIALIVMNVAVLRKKKSTSPSIERITEKTPEIQPISVQTEVAAEYRNTTPEIQTYEEIEMEIHTYEAYKSSGETEHPYGH